MAKRATKPRGTGSRGTGSRGTGSRGTGSEGQVRALIQSQLRANEVLLEGLRFTDPRHGDVEADFLILIPGSGIAVIEVKGGDVTLEDGQWLAQYGNIQRRIDPIEQARRVKHALRRYLDRQDEWTTGLVRAEWFVVLPFTDITSDMSTEARRELLIGKGDLGELVQRVRTALDSTLNNDPRPDADSIELALSLLLRKRDLDEESTPTEQTRWKKPAIWGSVAAAALLVTGGLIYSNSRELVAETEVEPRSTQTTGQCDPNYEPCIPLQDDLSCSDIKEVVTVLGTDVHDFDRDGDGIGCEIYQ